jgi:fructose-1,6-bisphosphatase/inositol monophosphatase family enzyme
LTVQSFLEVVLLARFPDVSFYSEEIAQSLNAKYFAAGAPLEVQVDPIDGTRPYIDNREHYQIIIAIHDREHLVGALCHMPRRARTYMAVRGQGAYVLAGQGGAELPVWQRLVLRSSDGPVLLFNNPELVRKLEPHFDTKDIVTHYASHPGRYHYTDLLEDRAIANVHVPCQAIDGGAMALIAEEAGGVATDFSGRLIGSYRESQKRIVPELVVAATPEIHERLLRVLR